MFKTGLIILLLMVSVRLSADEVEATKDSYTYKLEGVTISTCTFHTPHTSIYIDELTLIHDQFRIEPEEVQGASGAKAKSKKPGRQSLLKGFKSDLGSVGPLTSPDGRVTTDMVDGALIYNKEVYIKADHVLFLPKLYPFKNMEALYFEGHVFMILGHNSFWMDQFYYDHKNQKGIAKNVVIEIQDPRAVSAFLKNKEEKELSKLQKEAMLRGEMPLVVRAKTMHVGGVITKGVKIKRPAPKRERQPNNTYILKPRTRVDTYTIETDHIVPKAGPIPFFYLPGLDFTTNEEIVAGYRRLDQSFRGGLSSKDFGPFARARMGYRLNDMMRVEAFGDYFSKRGVGVGLGLRYKTPSAPGSPSSMRGKFHAYYIRDKGQDQEGVELVDRDRGRAYWFHNQVFRNHWGLAIEAQKESDAGFRQEFYREEFRREKDPEARIQLYRNGENHRLAFEYAVRADDFNTREETLGGIRYDVFSYELGETGLLYESGNQFANLRHNEAEAPVGNSYRSLRGDTWHRLGYPFDLGPIRVEPYAQGRGTWYSDTPDDRNADTRGQFEVGLKAATRLVGMYDDYRHVILPQAHGFHRSKPTVAPRSLFQFDEVDALTELDRIRFSLKNMVQKKANQRQQTILDWDMRADFFLHDNRDNNNEDWGPLEQEIRWFPRFPWISKERSMFFSKSLYDLDRNRFSEFTVGLTVNPRRRHRNRDKDGELYGDTRDRQLFSDEFEEQSGDFDPNLLSWSLEQRHLRDESNTTNVRVETPFLEKWRFGAEMEYEWDMKKGLRDYSFSLARDFHDWTLQVTLERDAGRQENRVLFDFFVSGETIPGAGH